MDNNFIVTCQAFVVAYTNKTIVCEGMQLFYFQRRFDDKHLFEWIEQMERPSTNVVDSKNKQEMYGFLEYNTGIFYDFKHSVNFYFFPSLQIDSFWSYMDMFIPFGSFDMNCTAYIKVYSLPNAWYNVII